MKKWAVHTFSSHYHSLHSLVFVVILLLHLRFTFCVLHRFYSLCFIKKLICSLIIFFRAASSCFYIGMDSTSTSLNMVTLLLSTLFLFLALLTEFYVLWVQYVFREWLVAAVVPLLWQPWWYLLLLWLRVTVTLYAIWGLHCFPRKFAYNSQFSSVLEYWGQLWVTCFSCLDSFMIFFFFSLRVSHLV